MLTATVYYYLLSRIRGDVDGGLYFIIYCVELLCRCGWHKVLHTVRRTRLCSVFYDNIKKVVDQNLNPGFIKKK